MKVTEMSVAEGWADRCKKAESQRDALRAALGEER